MYHKAHTIKGKGLCAVIIASYQDGSVTISAVDNATKTEFKLPFTREEADELFAYFNSDFETIAHFLRVSAS